MLPTYGFKVIDIAFKSSEKYQVHTHIHTYKGKPPKRNLFIKKLCIYSHTFKLQSRSQYSPFDAMHLLRFCFPLLKTIFELFQFWCLLGLPLFFISPLPHQQNLPFCGLFSSRQTNNQTKSLRVRSGEWEGWGIGSCHFWSTTAEHTARCMQVCQWITHHEMGKCVHWKNLQ